MNEIDAAHTIVAGGVVNTAVMVWLVTQLLRLTREVDRQAVEIRYLRQTLQIESSIFIGGNHERKYRDGSAASNARR